MTQKIAFDLGTHLGWVVFDEKIYDFGLLKLDVSLSINENFLAIYKLVRAFAPIETIYYEQTDWHRGSYPKEPFVQRLVREKINRTVQRSLGRLEGVLAGVAFLSDCRAVGVNVRDAKGSVSKKNAGKDKIAKAILKLYPELEGCEQDTLDAATVMHYALHNEPIILEKPKRKKKEKK